MCSISQNNEMCNRCTLCETAYFTNLLSRRRSMLASWWISRACNVVEASRRNKIWDTNVVKQLKDVKCEGLNVRVGRRFQRFFHRVESMQVWTASLAFKKDNMWSRTQSGKSLNMSSFLSSFLLWLCLCIALFIRSKTETEGCNMRNSKMW